MSDGTASLVKKILLWTGIGILLLVLVVGGGLYLLVHRGTSQTSKAQAVRRSQRKVHLGDSPQTVRLRVGVADSVGSFRDDSTRSVYWMYGHSPDFDAVIVFDSLKRLDVIFTGGDFLWAPEDGLDPSTFSDVDASLQSFQQVLGLPCDTVYADDSTWVRFYYHLAPKEANEDSVYRSWNRPSVVGRFLEVNLKEGKRVLYHGWTEMIRHCRAGR